MSRIHHLRDSRNSTVSFFLPSVCGLLLSHSIYSKSILGQSEEKNPTVDPRKRGGDTES